MTLSDKDKEEYSISKGVKVTGLREGKFKRAGVKEGFVITDINNITVTSSDDVEQIYDQIMHSKDSDKVMFVTGVYSTGKKMYYAIDLADE